MQVGVTEFLEKVTKLRTDQEKIEALKANDTFILRAVLQGAFDPNVKWLIPAGKPPYTPNTLVDQEHILINESRRLQYFVDGFYPGLAQGKREMMFIEFLERLAPKDAELLCAIKEKKLPFKGITVEHVMAAFPDMMPGYVPPVNTEVKEEKENFQEKAKVVCPHCGAEGTTERMMARYHFDNCKKKPVDIATPVAAVAAAVAVGAVVAEPTPDENGVYVAPDLSSL